MHMKYFLVITLVSIVLFSSSTPVYTSHVTKKQPTADERRLFDKIFERLEKHDVFIDTKIDDVKASLSDPVKIFISCRAVRDRSIESVSIDVSTQLTSFDEALAEQHIEGMLGAVYIWDCKAVKTSHTLTIECKNLLMLNPDFVVREETESSEKKIIAMAENEVILYHELLHGQMLLDAMKDSNDSLGWRKDACRYFAENGNVIDYSPSDAEHKIISGLEMKYLSRLIEQNDGVLIVKAIDKQMGSKRFTEIIARFDELGNLAESGFFVFTRTINLENAEVLVSNEERTISVSAMLQDPQKDGTVRMFIMPRLGVSQAHIEIEVDDTAKNLGSEFVFTATVRNKQKTDIVGSVTLVIDGLRIGGRDLSVPASKEVRVAFTWRSSDDKPSMHTAKVDGFNSASNEVSIMTFDRFVSATVQSDAVVKEQNVIDNKTGEKVTVAKLERIAGTVIGDKANVRLLAPDGTSVIGEEGLVDLGKQEHLIEVGGQTLVVTYTDLNENLRFFSVRSPQGELLPQGEWILKAIDISGQDADAKIKYYTSYRNA